MAGSFLITGAALITAGEEVAGEEAVGVPGSALGAGAGGGGWCPPPLPPLKQTLALQQLL